MLKPANFHFFRPRAGREEQLWNFIHILRIIQGENLDDVVRIGAGFIVGPGKGVVHHKGITYFRVSPCPGPDEGRVVWISDDDTPKLVNGDLAMSGSVTTAERGSLSAIGSRDKAGAHYVLVSTGPWDFGPESHHRVLRNPLGLVPHHGSYAVEEDGATVLAETVSGRTVPRADLLWERKEVVLIGNVQVVMRLDRLWRIERGSGGIVVVSFEYEDDHPATRRLLVKGNRLIVRKGEPKDHERVWGEDPELLIAA